MRRLENRESGFTLIEAMFAIGIIVPLSFAVMTVMMSALNGNANALAAIGDLQYVVEQAARLRDARLDLDVAWHEAALARRKIKCEASR